MNLIQVRGVRLGDDRRATTASWNFAWERYSVGAVELAKHLTNMKAFSNEPRKQRYLPATRCLIEARLVKMQFSTWRTVWPNLKLLGNRAHRILSPRILLSRMESYLYLPFKIFLPFTEFNAINISIVQFGWNSRGSRNVLKDILANFEDLEEFRSSIRVP